MKSDENGPPGLLRRDAAGQCVLTVLLQLQNGISPSFLEGFLRSLYRWKAVEVYFPMQLASHAKYVQNFVGIEKSECWSS